MIEERKLYSQECWNGVHWKCKSKKCICICHKDYVSHQLPYIVGVGFIDKKKGGVNHEPKTA